MPAGERATLPPRVPIAQLCDLGSSLIDVQACTRKQVPDILEYSKFQTVAAMETPAANASNPMAFVDRVWQGHLVSVQKSELQGRFQLAVDAIPKTAVIFEVHNRL